VVFLAYLLRRGVSFVGALLLLGLLLAVLLWSPPLRPVASALEPEAAGGGLAAFPRPGRDNGRGIHWVPTERQPPAAVAAFLPVLDDMGVRWLVLLASPGSIEYPRFLPGHAALLQGLRQRGIEPVLRIYAPVGPVPRRPFAQYLRYYRSLGVRYFQIFNEPNRPDEWQYPWELSPRRYVDYWLPLADLIAQAGGYPGVAALDPQARAYYDLPFLRETLVALREKAAPALLERTWLAAHLYLPIEADSFRDHPQGLARHRLLDGVTRDVLGRPLPIVATEGVLASGDERWRHPEAAALQARWVVEAYEEAARGSGSLMAFAPWVLGNLVAGGHDRRWESAAFFRADTGPQPVVDAVLGLNGRSAVEAQAALTSPTAIR